jgi:hypothetical protein
MKDVTPETVFAGWGALGRRRVGGWGVATIARHDEGSRVDLGPEVDRLVLKYGKPGVLRANDVRGTALQEVRSFDFSDWPRGMGDADQWRMRSVMHSPQWALISANGMRVCKPITGRWYWQRDGFEFERLSRLPVVGEVER